MSAPSERRRSKRHPILQSFSFFVVVPKKGVFRLPVHDLSGVGLGFDYDMEGEEPDEFPLEKGEILEVQFYLNQSLFIPLQVKVVRILKEGNVRRVGAEIQDRDKKTSKALEALTDVIDQIADIAQIATG